MPIRAPKLCDCGKLVAFGARCACKAGADRERKARFDAKRPNSSARGYSGKWERARAAYLKQHPYCVRCGERADHLDHIEPHKGDAVKFWDKTNWQGLCQYHHNSAKQREEWRANKGMRDGRL
jgi:5-methylcytosine-specific restriction enzyme A